MSNLSSRLSALFLTLILVGVVACSARNVLDAQRCDQCGIAGLRSAEQGSGCIRAGGISRVKTAAHDRNLRGL
jgi:hypothetical protein